MGTIVYSNIVELLLEEGDKTKEEICQEAIKRFEFPEENLSGNIGFDLLVKEKTGYVFKNKEEKYHLLSLYNDSIIGRTKFLEILGDVPENYLKERPHIKKLKQALEERML